MSMEIINFKTRKYETVKKGQQLTLSSHEADLFDEVEENIYASNFYYDLTSRSLHPLGKVTVREVKINERGDETAVVTPFRARQTYRNTIIINLSKIHHILAIA